MYKLDQIQASAVQGGQNADLGPLPFGAKALLGTLAGAWSLILITFLFRYRRKRRK